MFGMRILIFLLAIGLVVWILIRLARGSSLQDKSKSTAKVDEMVRCAKCGVFTPRSEATSDGDKFYCSPAHRDEDH